MKILFCCCYVNNYNYIEITKKCLDKYLLNCDYDYICLNDAPDVKNGEENYLQIVSMLEGKEDCYEKIIEESNKNNFIHIKIPQNIHTKKRPNHGGPRHIENFNYFNSNIDNLYPNYKNYDFLCYIDSDVFLSKYLDLNIELNNVDIAAPMIYAHPTTRYPHTGLFFINLKSVTNFKELDWSNTGHFSGTDTGSEIINFISRNKQYIIKELGRYNGFSEYNWIQNEHTIIKLDIPEISEENYKIIDIWFDKKFLHLRAGSCFGIGSLQHREKVKNVENYNKKLQKLFDMFE